MATRVTCHYPAGVTVRWLVSLLMIQPLVQSLVIQFVLSRRGPFIHGSLVSAQSQMWVRRSVICRQSHLFSQKIQRSPAHPYISKSLSSNTPCRESPLFLSSTNIVNKHHLRHIRLPWHNFRLRFVTYISAEMSLLFWTGRCLRCWKMLFLIKINTFMKIIDKYSAS